MTPTVYYVFVESNVAAGKSTLISRVEPELKRLFTQNGTAGADIITVLEPITQWTNVGGSGHNLLHAFYQDKQRFAALFQSHAMVTRVQAVDEAIARWCIDEANKGPQQQQQEEEEDGANEKPQTLYVLCERSIFTDRHVFVEALQQEGAMTPLEVAAYKTWWDFWQMRLYPGTIAAVLHLQCSADRCAAQMKQRDRTEEAGVPVAYLQHLAALHDAALADDATWRGAPRMTLDVDTLGHLPTDDAAAKQCAGRIYQFLMDHPNGI